MFEFENTLANLDEKVVIVVHLLDDFDEVGYQFLLYSGVT